MGCLLEAALGRQLIQNTLETAALMGWVLWTRRRRLWSRLRGARGPVSPTVSYQSISSVTASSPPSASRFRAREPSLRAASARLLGGETSPPEFQTFALAPGAQSLAAFHEFRLPNRDVYPLKLRIFTCEDRIDAWRVLLATRASSAPRQFAIRLPSRRRRPRL